MEIPKKNPVLLYDNNISAMLCEVFSSIALPVMATELYQTVQLMLQLLLLTFPFFEAPLKGMVSGND